MILAVLALSILVFNLVQSYSKEMVTITDGMTLSKDNLCNYYNIFGEDKNFNLCSLENDKCVNMKFLKNPC